MKRLVVCCDGTWSRLDAKVPTNVVKLAANIAPQDAAGVSQIVYYDEGVGTYASELYRFGRLAEGAFGWGLDLHLEDAYRFLCLNYDAEDEIFVFGFSRGAFTARSLCGLIRKCGILRRDNIRQASKAIAVYRLRDEGADSEAATRFRAANSRGKVSHKSVRDEIAGELKAHGIDNIDDAAKLVLAHDPNKVQIAYVGVWDTVGSLGVPNNWLLSRVLNERYRFHDPSLSSLVSSARHAIAIDEPRATFLDVPWDNLDKLNSVYGPLRVNGRDHQRYRQSWFPGDHGCVGGGTDISTPLSEITLQWIADGAALMGLTFLQRYASGWSTSTAYSIDFPRETGLVSNLLRLPGVKARSFVGTISDVSDVAALRWQQRKDYRPGTLLNAACLGESTMNTAAAQRGLPKACDPAG